MTDLYDFLLKDIGTSFPWDSKLPADFDKDKSDVHMTYYLLVNFRHAEVIKKAEDNLSLGFAYQLFAAYSCFATFQFQKLGYFAERVLSDKEIDAYPFQKNRCLTLLFDSIVRGGGNPNELNKYTKNSVLNDFYQSIFDIKSGQMETAPKLLRQNIKKIPAGAMIGLFNGAKTVLSPREISRLSSSPVLGDNLKLYYHHVQDLKRRVHLKRLPRSCSVSTFSAWFGRRSWPNNRQPIPIFPLFLSAPYGPLLPIAVATTSHCSSTLSASIAPHSSHSARPVSSSPATAGSSTPTPRQSLSRPSQTP